MLALFSLILVIVGCANWLCIGLLQFDFVAGIFGSQSNIFSRIIYVVIGAAAIVLTVNIIKNKGKIGFNFKKLKFKKDSQPAMQMEVSKDMSKDAPQNHTSQPTATSTQQSPYSTAPRYNNNQNFKNISQKLSEKHNENKGK